MNIYCHVEVIYLLAGMYYVKRSCVETCEWFCCSWCKRADGPSTVYHFLGSIEQNLEWRCFFKVTFLEVHGAKGQTRDFTTKGHWLH